MTAFHRSAARAAELLGWGLGVLAETTLLGRRVIPVVKVHPDAHRLRLTRGARPEFDPDVLAMWEWPQCAATAPPSPLGLVGVIVHARSRPVSRAVAHAREWRGFGAAAVLPPKSLITDAVRFECDVAGVGLLTVPTAPPQSDPWPEPGLVIPAVASRRPPSRRRTADRWIEEVLYAQAQDQNLFPTHTGGLW